MRGALVGNDGIVFVAQSKIKNVDCGAGAVFADGGVVVDTGVAVDFAIDIPDVAAAGAYSNGIALYTGEAGDADGGDTVASIYTCQRVGVNNVGVAVVDSVECIVAACSDVCGINGGKVNRLDV